MQLQIVKKTTALPSRTFTLQFQLDLGELALIFSNVDWHYAVTKVYTGFG
jgi:hypothetical protein